MLDSEGGVGGRFRMQGRSQEGGGGVGGRGGWVSALTPGAASPQECWGGPGPRSEGRRGGGEVLPLSRIP